MLGALLLRLWQLGARSLWTDEGSTWTAATSTLGALIHRCLVRDASPPLYYLLTSLTLKLDRHEAGLRLVSVLASLALVWLSYRIARLFAGRGEATLAAAIVMLSPFQVMYAQEARTYATVGAFTVAALYQFARAVIHDRRRAWTWFVAFSVLALYTQTIAALGIAVQVAWIVLTHTGRRHARAWAVATAIAVLAYLPWLIASARQAGELGESHWYLTAPGGHGVFQVLRTVFLSPLSLVTPPRGTTLPGLDAILPRPAAWLLLLAIVLVPLAWSVRSIRAAWPRGHVVRLCAFALFLPLAAVLAASVKVPLWLPRYFVLLTPFLAVLQAAGIARMRPRGLATTAAAALLLVNTYGTFRYQVDYTKEPWREVAAHIAEHAHPGRSAVLVPFDLDPFAFYDAQLPHPLAAYEVSHPAEPFAAHFTPRELDETEAAARRNAAPWDEVWVIVRSPNSPVRREVARRARRAAATAGRVQVGGEEVWNSVGGPLWVTRYARPGR
ncbi:MAG TPA: glycosyltransferase family 39 protein [Candidatus Eisenbacteria bacterium]|nr:glycosyltransferase family 39 protein [Candidatus Eisenbacteria bacterium]